MPAGIVLERSVNPVKNAFKSAFSTVEYKHP